MPPLSTGTGIVIGSVHEFPLLIVEAHLDTFGHVNNATYLQLFEQARWDWITRGGYGLERVQATRQGPVILDCTLQFRREVTNRQPVVIRTWIEKLGAKVASLRQELALAALGHAGNVGDVCCAATFTMAFFDLSSRRIIAPTPDWLATFGLGPEHIEKPSA